jgi:hypothetical protein
MVHATLYTVKTVKQPASVMASAYFSGACGRGSISFLFLNVIKKEKKIPTSTGRSAPPLYGNALQHPHFLHDSAPCHALERIKNFLKNKSIQVMDWPENSQNLNPIEDAWKYMKNKLKTEDTSSVPS